MEYWGREETLNVGAFSGGDAACQTGYEPEGMQGGQHLKIAEEAKAASISLRQKAESTTNDDEKQDLLFEAREQKKKSISEMKIVKRLQSGVWQGGAAGAGIGAGIGAGVGTVVGALVGGVAAIPTTGLGMLAGVGVGAVHGPWVRFGKGGDGKEGEGMEEEGQKKSSS
ncbi:hypothetical protein G7Y89_g7222 [Cudoniella acicularis]|uniref:Uncharacterized protein n=1 Tax=Cudoniella acicularis TaxID=354080 RepID=A0A8H4W2A3_9HELO|nr:hypothetical protein G7Y89_g7222 [Cudoniella acicularis]